MKNFLEKYNANRIETSKDEGMLTLEKAKERILNLLTENMRNFKDNTWDVKNRMNKLITDTEKNSIFNLRLGGKRIARYSLDLLNTGQKLNFLADFYTSVSNGEFDEDIIDFLAKEVDNATVRKKEANARRRAKKKEERERKAKEAEEAKKAEEAQKTEETKDAAEDAVARTIAAAEPLLQEIGITNPRAVFQN